jgi:hypothetical protein
LSVPKGAGDLADAQAVSVQAPFTELKCCTVPFYCSLHAKEEDILFPAMEMADILGEGGPIGGMLAASATSSRSYRMPSQGKVPNPICFRINEQLSKTFDHPVAE